MDKNVLILSRGFNAGDAITTLNLFSQWPKEHLFCASLADSEYSKEVAEFYFLGDKEITYAFPFNRITHPAPSHRGYYRPTENSQIKKSLKMTIYETVVRPILQRLDLYETRFSLSISPEFEEWMRAINPEIIYTSIGDMAMAQLIIKLHHKYPDVKFVIHGFDDWMSPSYKIWNKKFHRKKAERLFQKILSFSSARFTSSEKMSRNYLKKYGYEFTCFPNPVKIPTHISKTTKVDTVPNIVFTGKVGWHNHQAINDMINAIKELNKNGIRIKFDIYTDTPVQQLGLFLGQYPDFIVIHKPVLNHQIFRILASSRILYLPINISSQTSKFTKYSMSTKMGEYLSSGVPMIYYGPEGIAMTEFLQENNCAKIISSRDNQLIINTIISCIESDTSSLTTKGLIIARKYFNIDTISRAFLDVLKNI